MVIIENEVGAYGTVEFVEFYYNDCPTVLPFFPTSSLTWLGL